MKGQIDTIGIAMQRAILGEMEGTDITRVKSEADNGKSFFPCSNPGVSNAS